MPCPNGIAASAPTAAQPPCRHQCLPDLQPDIGSVGKAILKVLDVLGNAVNAPMEVSSRIWCMPTPRMSTSRIFESRSCVKMTTVCVCTVTNTTWRKRRIVVANRSASPISPQFECTVRIAPSVSTAAALAGDGSVLRHICLDVAGAADDVPIPGVTTVAKTASSGCVRYIAVRPPAIRTADCRIFWLTNCVSVCSWLPSLMRRDDNSPDVAVMKETSC